MTARVNHVKMVPHALINSMDLLANVDLATLAYNVKQKSMNVCWTLAVQLEPNVALIWTIDLSVCAEKVSLARCAKQTLTIANILRV